MNKETEADSITAICPACKQELEIPAELAGPEIQCPACQATFKIMPVEQVEQDVSAAPKKSHVWKLALAAVGGLLLLTAVIFCLAAPKKHGATATKASDTAASMPGSTTKTSPDCGELSNGIPVRLLALGNDYAPSKNTIDSVDSTAGRVLSKKAGLPFHPKQIDYNSPYIVVTSPELHAGSRLRP